MDFFLNFFQNKRSKWSLRFYFNIKTGRNTFNRGGCDCLKLRILTDSLTWKNSVRRQKKNIIRCLSLPRSLSLEPRSVTVSVSIKKCLCLSLSQHCHNNCCLWELCGEQFFNVFRVSVQHKQLNDCSG